MSSHREAPAISKDPVADSTDVYAFVDPVAHANGEQVITIICNYIPLEAPAGGPNFYEFGGYTPSDPQTLTSVPPIVYDININNDGTGVPNVTYRFTFTTTIVDPNSFLYANGPIMVAASGNGYTLAEPDGSQSGWNRPQTYTIERIENGVATQLVEETGDTLYCPPCNLGPRSTPNYSQLSAAAQYTLASREKVFAGQRAEAFWVDLGSIFDLGDLRPLSGAHLIKGAATNGINPLADVNVHSIAIQVPTSMLTSTTAPPAKATDPTATIGIWTTASRPAVKMQNANGTYTYAGALTQVSRLGNPLVNEVVVPMGSKDYFNGSQPANDKQYAAAVENPELQNLLPVLYPGAFPDLAAFIKAGNPRTDLVAIFATGIPSTVVPGFAGTYQGGGTIAEMLRLNTMIAPTTSTSAGYSPLGVIGGDIGGFPNGRRVADDVVTIELQAVGGATIPLTYPTYKPDAVIGKPGLNEESPPNTAAMIDVFPYIADPWPGFSNPTGTPTNDNGASGTNFTPSTTSS